MTDPIIPQLFMTTPRTLRQSDSHYDACGLGFLTATKPQQRTASVKLALSLLERLEHRGACAADGCADGAGITTQIPRKLLGSNADAVGMVFLPANAEKQHGAQTIIEEELTRVGYQNSTWRSVPTDESVLPERARVRVPIIKQLLARGPCSSKAERDLYLARRRCMRRFSAESLGEFPYICSLSTQTIVYKALCSASQLAAFYPDLTDPRFETNAAVFHRRFSTNTAPAWPLVQPLRMTAHNGEFNTLEGNVSWLRARGTKLGQTVFGADTPDIHPLVSEGDSDSVTFDRLFELLVIGGREPTEVMTMLCPEPYAHMPDMSADVRAMCRFHSEIIEPWDGPAAIVFFDGQTIGAGLDRNGLRPFRFEVTDDGWIVGASEGGLLDGDTRRITKRGRLGPGHTLCVDLASGVVQYNDDIKRTLAAQRPYANWVSTKASKLTVTSDEAIGRCTASIEPELLSLQLAFGYAKEDINRIIEPMVQKRTSPIGSMGDDTPLAALSKQPQQLYRFLKQRFAQVTNPPIDSIRERLNMSLETSLGRHVDVLVDAPSAARCKRFASPIISERDLARLCIAACEAGVGEAVASINCSYNRSDGDLRACLGQICAAAANAVRSGIRLLILSDRAVGPNHVAVPMLLTVASVHERLVQEGLRLHCSLICETGEPREDHHFACLLGFGATLIVPYLAFRAARALADQADGDEAVAAYREAVESGVRKIMAKMGVTVIQSYRGAGLFDIVGLAPEVVATAFPRSPAFPGHYGMSEIAADQAARHAAGFGASIEKPSISERGIFRFRRNGETHARAPQASKALHKAVRSGNSEDYAAYMKVVADLPPINPRDLLTWDSKRKPIEIRDVEPADAILRHLCMQAMSHGALSRDAHELLAISGNRLGVRTNSGEGGEVIARLRPYTPHDNPRPDFQQRWQLSDADTGCSAIKQIASGRFGVTAEYLSSAREFEIKMAQGAKPGEGGQIPGFKVTAEIAVLRHTEPGTPLISPPPHHDIYSIEDLAQLIHDLKTVNPDAPVTVKLVAALNIGTIACGVAKAGADMIAISGGDGGTGAAALSSIKHAGLPWEIGLTLAQRALAESDLRQHVSLRVDGGLATGRDVVTAMMFGADEAGFGTTALIAAGCVMARRCHDNTCPVGIASQDEKLRAKLPGTPEHIIALFSFIAEEIRGHLASLGCSTLAELTGQVAMLGAVRDQKRALDLDELIRPPTSGARKWNGQRNPLHPVDSTVDLKLLAAAAPALAGTHAVQFDAAVDVADRSLGSLLAGRIGRQRLEGINSIAAVHASFTGTAGQSFGAFCTHPMRLDLQGVAQDGVGKSMSGGEITIAPREYLAAPRQNTIAGNSVLYGATGGRVFLAGGAGERFAVRNSGADAVAEGCGDHGCEYMTGGRVVLLGPVGRNFGAGMTGGVAWVLDDHRYLERHCAAETAPSRMELRESDELYELIALHANRTGSAIARSLLDDWRNCLRRFVAVDARSSR